MEDGSAEGAGVIARRPTMRMPSMVDDEFRVKAAPSNRRGIAHPEPLP